VPFTHHVEIYQLQDVQARYYYIHRTAEEHLSVDRLKQLINTDAYDSQQQMPSNFTKTIPDARMMRKAVMMFKDSYMLDYINVEEIGLRDSIDVDERVVEKEIVSKVKNFIMTIGHDFTFMGNQQLLEVYGVEHFPDLLFFNRELNAMVVDTVRLWRRMTRRSWKLSTPCSPSDVAHPLQPRHRPPCRSQCPAAPQHPAGLRWSGDYNLTRLRLTVNEITARRG